MGVLNVIARHKFRLVGRLKGFLSAVYGWFLRQKGRGLRSGKGSSLVVQDFRVETHLAPRADFSSEERFYGSELRLRCLKVLRASQPLTIPEVAARLGLAFSAVEPMVQELRAARLVELSGIRRVGERVRGLFSVNPQHPGLEFLLGSAPSGLRYPEGYFGERDY